MPTIPRLKDSKKETSDSKKLHQKLYHNTKWRKLRDLYFMSHPLCESCLEKGITKAGVDVHHKVSPFYGQMSEQQRITLLLDWNNLITLCRDCHNAIHNPKKNRL